MSIKLKGATSGSVSLDVPAAVSGGDVSLTLPDGVGSAGQVLKNGSTAGTLEYGEAGLKSIQTFTTAGSHTWTKPSGITRIKVYVTGGGGGGGGARNYDIVSYNGGGGSAGGTAIEVIDVSGVSSVAVTVGAGGAGGTTGANVGNVGGTGGTSSFGSYCSATGGAGGNGGGEQTKPGADAGVGTGGDINLKGGCASGPSDTNNWIPLNPGGDSFWGGGAASRGVTGTSTFTGGQAAAHGGGGWGGLSRGTVAAELVGSVGAPGLVVVEEYA